MKKIITTIVLTVLAFTVFGGPATTVSNIHIDQFGYRENAQKIAVISQAQVGFNAPEAFTPGSTYELRKWEDDAIVFTGSPTAWKAGATHEQSGDKVWRFDFSSHTAPGEYYVWDVQNEVGSYKFLINDDVYNIVLKHAMRTYFYQRAGFAKESPYAEAGWTDAASHLGPEQDLDCRDAKNPTPETSRDLHGGWFDAGDYNKYMNYADETVSNLLYAYEENPTVFTDDYNIPESGNGVEDILDEIKWELEWMLRMQEDNGSCIHKVSNTCYCDASPPSEDDNIHRYLAPTISATISGCVTYSHAAIVYKNHSNLDMKDFGATLEAAAIKAWDYIMANETDIPSNADNTGFVNGAIEDDEYHQRANLVAASAYMFALTGETKYRDYLDDIWRSNYIHLRQWYYAYVYEQHYQDALLYYADLPNATSSVANEIRSRYTTSITGENHLEQVEADADAYLSYCGDNIYIWGSSRNKCQQATMYTSMNKHGMDVSNSDVYMNTAENFIHYMHGLNPLNFTFLTNMSAYGAENSANTFYHGWFRDGSAQWDEVGVSTYGPPPGYVPGGVNPNFAPDASCNCTLEPPVGQPILKSYRDWNASWPENSWEVTENSITYQAAYVRLLSKFAGTGEVINDVPNALSNTHLSISPNPSEGPVEISGWLESGTINITNQTGQIIHSDVIVGSAPYILNKPLKTGSYIIHVTTSSGSQTGKLIVQ